MTQRDGMGREEGGGFRMGTKKEGRDGAKHYIDLYLRFYFHVYRAHAGNQHEVSSLNIDFLD